MISPYRSPRITVQNASTARNVPAASRIRRWARAALRGEARVAIRIVGAAEGRLLNRSYRRRDYATNVLTFEYGCDPDGTLSADIVLCLAVLKKEAREQKKPLLHHAAHLVIHGTLHALGYDHEDNRDAQRMESLETEILSNMRIPDPYLAR